MKLYADAEHPDHVLVPLVCGHDASIYDRSSWWDFPEDGDYCRVCQKTVAITEESMQAIIEWQNEPIPPTIHPYEINWQRDRDDTDAEHIFSQIRVAGILMTLDAIRVDLALEMDGPLHAADPSFEEALLQRQSAFGITTERQTMQMNGRPYCLFIYPSEAEETSPLA